MLQDEERGSVLVLAWGNPSRGDDAIGPLVIERLRELRLPDVRLETDFQLQVEHVIDMHRCERVLFVDAAVDTDAPFHFEVLAEQNTFEYSTHTLAPGALLAVYRRVYGEAPPPCYMLSVAAAAFELGEPLSAAASANLEQAMELLVQLLHMSRGGDWQQSCRPRREPASRPVHGAAAGSPQ